MSSGISNKRKVLDQLEFCPKLKIVTTDDLHYPVNEYFSTHTSWNTKCKVITSVVYHKKFQSYNITFLTSIMKTILVTGSDLSMDIHLTSNGYSIYYKLDKLLVLTLPFLSFDKVTLQRLGKYSFVTKVIWGQIFSHSKVIWPHLILKVDRSTTRVII